MRFEAIAVSHEQFEAWLQESKNHRKHLIWPDTRNCRNRPTAIPVTYFFFGRTRICSDYIIGKYHASMDHDPEAATRQESASMPMKTTAPKDH